ncbi:Methyltransferase domain protein [Acididesulfobacillus acetoxydans]|uniref:Methyltransferase domain protein n=1 Tax=Acididesulfobacillus acetoxydans TaxID=1561005 RepID=A0A8S0XD77_9FIRM|nr:tRNA (adenine(22)-N(1))-methyltransferase TrmK [Acididesulfobacillus acetoxydans]CAA7603216.1 Methyltransferase domain protein [Acididesulfobacillus acetoxydans]
MTVALLGPRLAAVAARVPRGAKLGDIGTDHAYLPVTLCEEGRIQSAVAVDVHRGPYESALATVRGRGLIEKISVRFGDGLSPLVPGEVDTLVLAGMGGSTMTSILSRRPEILAGISALILQPQGAESQVRRSLLTAGWLLQDEVLVEEEGKIYVVMAMTREPSRQPPEPETEGRRRDRMWQMAAGQRPGFLSFRDVDEIAEGWVGRLKEIGAEALRGLNAAEPAGEVGEIFASSVRTLVWQLGPVIVAQPNSLLRRLLAERIRELDRRLQQMKKAKSPGASERVTVTLVQKLACEGMSVALSGMTGHAWDS